MQEPAPEEALAKAEEETKGWGPISGLLLGFLVFIGAQIFGGLVIGFVAGANDQSFDDYYDQNPIMANFIISVCMAVFTVAFILLVTRGYDSLKALKLKTISLLGVLWVPPAGFVYVMLSATLLSLATFYSGFDVNQAQDTGFGNAAGGAQLVLAFIALVILAPISEEILFRGYVFQGLKKKLHWVPSAIIVSGLFGLAHMQLNVGLDTFAMGFMACVLLEMTGSLWTAILLHIIKNFVAFYFLYIAG